MNDNDDVIEFLKVNRYEVEQNAVFIDFEEDKLIHSIRNYKNENYHYRLSLVKNLPSILEICNNYKQKYDFLLMIAKDSQQMQRELLEYYKLYIKREKIKQDYKQYILNPITTLITGTYLEIKQQATTILSEISDQLHSQQLKSILAFTLKLMNQGNQEDKIVAIQLLAKLTPNLQQKQTEQFILKEYIPLYQNSSVRIKKQIINQICIASQYVSTQFLDEKIISQFILQKSKETVWGIRKACVDIMPLILRQTKNKNIKRQLSQRLQLLLKDNHKIVKLAAYKITPQFIANYGDQNIPQKLFDIYIKLIDNEINKFTNRQNQILQKVSFYFPGILFVVGKSKWNQLKRLFQRLINFKSQNVKLPISSALYDISKILGSQLSKEYIFTALDKILKGTSDNAKLRAIEHLSEFVELFEPSTRQNLIDVFLVLQKDPKKWRIRFSIAHQLPHLARIYDPQTIFKYIFPISLKLCNDNVSQVRHEAASQIYYVLQTLKQNKTLYEMGLQSIKGYGQSDRSIQRQTFTIMLQNIYKVNNFANILMVLVQKLAKDSIIIVKIGLAISLSKIINNDDKMKTVFKNIINQLKNDQKDVSQYFD